MSTIPYLLHLISHFSNETPTIHLNIRDSILLIRSSLFCIAQYPRFKACRSWRAFSSSVLLLTFLQYYNVHLLKLNFQSFAHPDLVQTLVPLPKQSKLHRYCPVLQLWQVRGINYHRLLMYLSVSKPISTQENKHGIEPDRTDRNLHLPHLSQFRRQFQIIPQHLQVSM